jgi:hypothetical protein
MFKKLNIKICGAIALAVVLCGLFLFAGRTNSQSKLKDIRLSAAQNGDLQSADREIEEAQKQLRSMLGNRQMLARGFAISEGIKPEEIQKFKFEKAADGWYHILEYSPEELKKIAEEQKRLAEQGGR